MLISVFEAHYMYTDCLLWISDGCDDDGDEDYEDDDDDGEEEEEEDEG